MKNYNFLKILFLFTFLFLTNFTLSDASQTGIDVNLNVGSCNNNGICESATEDMLSCPLDCVPPEEEEEGSGTGSTGSYINNYFENLTIEVGYNSATIKWRSNVPTISNLKWGTNPDYREGVLRNINFLLDHKVELTNLKEGTTYYFNIQAENFFGVVKILDGQIFQTLSSPDIIPPGNPTNIVIKSGSSGITVSWENPSDLDFDYIRVMRNDNRYYGDPLIGRLVYEGTGKYFTDSNVIEGHKYFYSLFSRDKAGNYSSGSLVSITHNPLGIDIPSTEVPPTENIKLLPNLFIVTQNSLSHDFYPGDNFSLSGDDIIDIKTNYSSKIKNDDMWVEIRNSEGIILSQYFFTRTKDSEGFIKVIIPSFVEEGNYRITIYRYDNNVTQIVNYGSFDIYKSFKGEESVWSFWFVLAILILLLLFILVVLILRKILRGEKKETP